MIKKNRYRNTVLTPWKGNFLKNENNKKNVINLLKKELSEKFDNIDEGDTNPLIVNYAH